MCVFGRCAFVLFDFQREGNKDTKFLLNSLIKMLKRDRLGVSLHTHTHTHVTHTGTHRDTKGKMKNASWTDDNTRRHEKEDERVVALYG